jgi:hypothetical protein
MYFFFELQKNLLKAHQGTRSTQGPRKEIQTNRGQKEPLNQIKA